MTIKGRQVSNGYSWMDFVIYGAGFCLILLLGVQILMLRTTISEQNHLIIASQTQISETLKVIEKTVTKISSKQDSQIVIDKTLLKIMKKSNPKLSAKEKHEYIIAITENAKKHNISPILIASMIHRETNFRKDLVSSVGAVGPMQTLPSHSKRIGVKVKEMKTISGGVKAGTKVLKEYLDASDNDYRKALHRYVGVKKNFHIGNQYCNDIFSMMMYALKE